MADRDIPEEMVEAATRRLYEVERIVRPFELLSPDRRAELRSNATKVLSAALAGRQVVDVPDDGHCSKCGQPFPENIRDVVRTEPRLPFDARDRIERVLHIQGVASGSVEGAAARIMRALTDTEAAGSGSGEN